MCFCEQAGQWGIPCLIFYRRLSCSPPWPASPANVPTAEYHCPSPAIASLPPCSRQSYPLCLRVEVELAVELFLDRYRRTVFSIYALIASYPVPKPTCTHSISQLPSDWCLRGDRSTTVRYIWSHVISIHVYQDSSYLSVGSKMTVNKYVRPSSNDDGRNTGLKNLRLDYGQTTRNAWVRLP